MSALRVLARLGLCLLLPALAVSGSADARSGGHPPRSRAAAKFKHQALPYNPRVAPTYTAYTPPGTIPVTVAGAPPPPPLCGDPFFAPSAPFARRVWWWTFDGLPLSPKDKRQPTPALAAAICSTVGSLLPELVTPKPEMSGALGGAFTAGDWMCDVATHFATCRNARAPGAVLFVQPVALSAAPPIHAGSVIGPANAPGQGIIARSDYYELRLSGVAALVSGSAMAVKYFMVVGRHECGVSAGATERAMAHAGGVILAISSRTAAAFAGPLYIRLPSSPAYRACLFLQQSGSDARAAALIQVPF